MAKNTFDELKPKVILGIAAHPDDLDFGAAGSIAKWVQEGTTAYYLILTDGSKGSSDRRIAPSKLIEMRRKEQRNAGKILGLKEVFFLNYSDGMLENTMNLKRDVVRYIRRLKPDTVITMDPSVLYMAERGFINHPDHRAAGQAALDAIFPLARDHLVFPELFAEGYEPHKVKTALLINMEHHNLAADITGTLDQKLQALTAHVSQFPDPKVTQTMIKDWAIAAGKGYNLPLAEVFMRIDVS